MESGRTWLYYGYYGKYYCEPTMGQVSQTELGNAEPACQETLADCKFGGRTEQA